MITEEKLENLRQELKLRFELTEQELEEFIKRLVVDTRVSRYKDLRRTHLNSKVWKKEDIERLGIEVKPVRWKKLR